VLLTLREINFVSGIQCLCILERMACCRRNEDFQMLGNNCRTYGKLIGRVANDVPCTWEQRNQSQGEVLCALSCLLPQLSQPWQHVRILERCLPRFQEQSNKLQKDESRPMNLFTIVTSVGYLANRSSDVPTLLL
jgi:hypothetical protein